MCKTAWSHGIFVITFCQITRAPDFVLRKGKDHPPEPFLPVSQAELVPSTFPGPVPAPSLPLQSLLSQGEDQECLRWLSQGLVSSSNSVFAASHCPSSLLLIAVPFSPGHPWPQSLRGVPTSAWLPQWCPHPGHLQPLVSSSTLLSPRHFPSCVSRCFQLLMAPSRCCLCGGTAALLQCLASIRNSEFLERN